ncbi:ATP-binding protein [Candidatus Riflebacteria bacterium]
MMEKKDRRTMELQSENNALRSQVKKLTKEVEFLKKDLQRAEKRAFDAHRWKTTCLANLNHEIRSPLNAIIGFTRILMQECKERKLPSVIFQFLENVSKSVEELSELFRNILDQAKIDANRLTVTEEQINLKLLVRAIFHLYKNEALKKGTFFHYDIDPSLPENIYSDRFRLNKILMNLSDNAVKFTPAAKNIRLKAIRENDFLLFIVEDEGIGITPDLQRVLFAGDPPTEPSSGLNMVKKSAELLGGTVEFKSEPGAGSTFQVKLPLSRPSVLADIPAEINGITSSSFQNKKVLIVEDELINQKMFKSLFEKWNLGIQLLDSQKIMQENAIWPGIEMVLIDENPGKLSLQRVCSCIRNLAAAKEIPIVVLTAERKSIQKNEEIDILISEYLTKPLDVDELLQVLNKHLFSNTAVTRDIKIKKSSLPMPEDLEKLVLIEFQKLAKIPIYKGGTLRGQVKKMMGMCEDFKSHYPRILKKVEEAVFEGDAEKMKKLLMEIRDEKSSDC